MRLRRLVTLWQQVRLIAGGGVLALAQKRGCRVVSGYIHLAQNRLNSERSSLKLCSKAVSIFRSSSW